MKRFLIPLALVILPAVIGVREAAATEAPGAATHGSMEEKTVNVVPPPPPGHYASSTLIPRFDVMGQGRMRWVGRPDFGPVFHPTTTIPCRRGYAAPPPWVQSPYGLPYGPWGNRPEEGFAGWERPPGWWGWGGPPPPVMNRR